MKPEEEKALVKRAAAGDERAFEALVTAHERTVYALARSRLKNEQDAQDAAQECFVRAWLNLSGFRGESRFGVWLCRIVHNVCTDMLRKKTLAAASLSVEDEQGGESELEIADERFSPERELERKETRESLARGLESLREEYRTALTLRELGGHSYEEIAETLNIDLGTVKSRIFRARKKLCAFLASEGNLSAPNPSEKKRGGARG